MTFDKVLIWVKGVPLPTPAYCGYTTKKEELVRAERNVGSSLSITSAISYIEGYGKGYLIKRHIAWKHTINVEWKGITAAEKSLIMEATGQVPSDTYDRDKGFKVRFLDMDTDLFIERMMYRGNDQQVSGYGIYDDETHQFQYYDVKMSLIEL